MNAGAGISPTYYDLIVIGGGAAGLIAAGRATERGARVLVLEKNRRPGRKLLISGGGRCNVTNAEADLHRLVARYGPEGKALYSVFAGFTPADMINFLHRFGVATKIEAEQRAFPADDRAESVLRALLTFAAQAEIRCSSPVTAVSTGNHGEARFRVETTAGHRYGARWVLIATGGYARPDTGSTGDGFAWLKTMGHTIIVPEPILVPIRIRERWCADLMGLSFSECGLAARRADEPPAFRAVGKLLFTHFGLSGPLVLNRSAEIDALSRGGRPLQIELDFFPSMDGGALERTLLDICERSPRRQVAAVLGELVPPRLAALIASRADVDPARRAAEVSRAARKAMVAQLKALVLTYAGRLGNDKAIVSRGGVPVDEVNFKTMESRIVPGLLLAGDVLDLDRPSGGFSLQICWSTGWRAGETAASTGE
ncbi:MAG: aminoacetone oxidase family FAD-binding enzyme [Spirochaetaceae bacterium]|nr:MAG: aminoacetone oxidase family FAD-binding enzyme [Spirochaetaceae bacterium]